MQTFPSSIKCFLTSKTKGRSDSVRIEIDPAHQFLSSVSSYVVRTGINFGVDYCIYHTLPSLCHSEMCVTVIDATKDSANSLNVCTDSVGVVKEDLNQLNWRHITTLTRVIPVLNTLINYIISLINNSCASITLSPQDVNKLCVICYVLPATELTRVPTCGQSAPVPAPSCVSPLDILADAVDDICVAAELAGVANAANADNCNNIISISAPEPSPAPPTVSPYLSTLFLSHLTSHPTTTEAPASTAMDYSSPACLESLSVHPVTALVRRMPALAETYQTIKMVQEAYHSASTAQKKRDIKAANQKEKFSQNNSANKGNKKHQYQKSKQATSSHNTTTTNSTNNNTEPNIATISNPTDSSFASAEQQAYLLTADPATLSGRQKRVAKYLQKSQIQQRTAVLLPQSKQLKERRDHRENRSKTMSNKNQSLLDLMLGGEKKHPPVSIDSNPNADSGDAGTAVDRADFTAITPVVQEEQDMEMTSEKGTLDTTEDILSGSKRKLADQEATRSNTDSHENGFWSIASRFYPFSPCNNSDSNSNRLSEIHDTHSLNTMEDGDVNDSTDITNAGDCADPSTTTTRRHKRCRTKYAQDEDGALNDATNDSYMGRAVKHCIIL